MSLQQCRLASYTLHKELCLVLPQNYSIMLRTIEWSGIPVITGSLTDFLLSVEDHLDDSEPLFVRLGGVWDILPRLTADFPKKHEDVMVLSDGLTAGCLALRTHGVVTSTSPAAFINFLLDLALENSTHILMVTDQPERYKDDAQFCEFQKASRLTVIPSDATSLHELSGMIARRASAIVLHDAPDTGSFQLFEQLVLTASRNLLWVQMPRQYYTHIHPAIRPKKIYKPQHEFWNLFKAKAYIFSNVFTTELRLS